MSFADEVAAVSGDYKQCKTCRILDEQPDREAIEEYMAEHPTHALRVALALTNRGYPVAEGSVRVHFREGHELR